MVRHIFAGITMNSNNNNNSNISSRIPHMGSENVAKEWLLLNF